MAHTRGHVGTRRVACRDTDINGSDVWLFTCAVDVATLPGSDLRWTCIGTGLHSRGSKCNSTTLGEVVWRWALRLDLVVTSSLQRASQARPHAGCGTCYSYVQVARWAHCE